MSTQEPVENPPIAQAILPGLGAGLESAGLTKQQIESLIPEIRHELIETARAVRRSDQGGPKIVVDEYFVGLNDIGGQVIESALKLALSSILAAYGHGDAAHHAKEALIDALFGLRKTVMKLDEAEQIVCLAILEITRRKRYKVFIEPGASESEIADDFKNRDEQVPPELGDLLRELASGEPKVLEAAKYDNRGPFYQVRF